MEAGLFDRFNEHARQTLAYAKEEAQRLNHPYLGTEHLLLGLVRQKKTLATMTLESLGVELRKVRSAVEFIIGRPDRMVLGEAGLTPRAKTVLKLAADEARRLKHDSIGPEHLLLGLIREGQGIAAGVLESLGVNLEKARTCLIRLLQHLGGPERAAKQLEAERQLLHSRREAEKRALSWQAARLRPYTPLHLQASHPGRTAIGAGGAVILGLVVIGTGGDYTLTLYDGLAPDAPSIAMIANPKTGHAYPFDVALERGLSYTPEGTPGSVTILYNDLPN